MHSTLEFLIKHGYVVLLAWVFAEQLGLPIPSLPLVLAAGALSGTGHLSFWASLFFVAIAALSADSFWYALGRTKGIRILQFLCKISLEPDSCVRRTEGIFSKQGARSLLLAKFIPGLSTVAPPLAGIFHMRARKFLLFDGLGSLVWGFFDSWHWLHLQRTNRAHRGTRCQARRRTSGFDHRCAGRLYRLEVLLPAKIPA